MPADEYSSAVRGGLKLKGSSSSKPQGIKKKKKKAKEKDPSNTEASAIQKALADEDVKQDDELSEGQLRELEERGRDGKTASEKAYEDMRKKRVGFSCTTTGETDTNMS